MNQLTRTNAGSSALTAPKPGETWVTENGVTVAFAAEGASRPYTRLTYVSSGRRVQSTCGRIDQWPSAWELACRIDAEIQREQELEAGKTIEAVIADFLRYRGRTWSATYAEAMSAKISKRIIPAIGHLSVTQWNSELTADFLHDCPEKSRHGIYKALSSLTNWAIANGWMPGPSSHYLLPKDELLSPAPAQGRTRPASSSVKGSPGMPSDLDDDVEEGTLWIAPDTVPTINDALAAVSWLHGIRCHSLQDGELDPVALMFLTAAFTGLRQGELWALKGRHVADHMLLVRQQLQWISSCPEFLPPKTRSKREVAVPDLAGDYRLWDLLVERADTVGASGLMFPTPLGCLWRRGNFTRDVMDPLRAESSGGQPAGPWVGHKWTFHGLRHAYCRWMLDSGHPASDVAEQAGHANVEVTLKMYVSPNEDTAARVLRRMQEAA